MPQNFTGDVSVIGVELDSITGRMLQKLYPDARIHVSGFEDVKNIADNSVDLVISNFPFGNIPIHDKQHPEYSGWSIHNYFFGRSIDALRPGGLVVAITSHFTLDASSNSKMRRTLANKADFIGAIRLPRTAFAKNAGTEVVTDIIVMRKKDGVSSEYAQAFVNTREIRISAPGISNAYTIGEEMTREIGKPDGNTAVINEYFVDHPDMVLGKHSLQGSMYGGNEYTVEPFARDTIELIDGAVTRFPRNIAGEGNAETREYAETGIKERMFVYQEGKLYQVENGTLARVSWVLEKVDRKVNGKKAGSYQKGAVVVSYIDLRNGVRALLDLQRNPESTEAEIDAAIKVLNRKHDDFVRRYGNVNSAENRKFLSLDADFPVGGAIEHVNQEYTVDMIKSGPKKGTLRQVRTLTISKSDLLKKRTLWPFVRPEKAESASDAVMISMVYSGRVDVPYVAELLGMTEEQARSSLACL